MQHAHRREFPPRRAGALVGAAGMAIAVVADFFSLYSPEPAANLPTLLTLSLRDLLPLLVAKPLSHLMAGHILILVGLSLGLAGVWAISPQIRSRFPVTGRITIAGAVVSYLLGVAWHTSLGFLGASVSGVTDPALHQEVLARLGPMALTTTVLFYGFGLATFAFLFVQLLRGVGAFPRWMAWVSPLPIHVVGFVVAAFLPSLVGTALQYTLSNISLVVFYVLATVHLTRTGQAPL